jgi:hypothetical protein
MDTWTFIWLILILKIPVGALLWIVWWAVHQNTDPVPDEDGGTKHLGPRPRHPHRPLLPRSPRRGPHAGHAPQSPARVRTVTARARSLER